MADSSEILAGKLLRRAHAQPVSRQARRI